MDSRHSEELITPDRWGDSGGPHRPFVICGAKGLFCILPAQMCTMLVKLSYLVYQGCFLFTTSKFRGHYKLRDQHRMVQFANKDYYNWLCHTVNY